MTRTAASLRQAAECSFSEYISELRSKLRTGKATEHTYRGALQIYIESIEAKIEAVNEPKRVRCGAPDYIVSKGRIPVGYVEAKDIGEDLDKVEKSDQLKRYFASLSNLILTDYIEFRWYVNGEKRLTIKIGEISRGVITFDQEAEDKLESFFKSFLDAEVPTIKSAEELAHRLAGTTKNICSLIEDAYELEEKNGWLHRWLNAFSEVLISDLKPDAFADMFAQTLAYGFFAARVHHTANAEFSRFAAAKILPKTNPFLRQLFAEFAGVNMPDEISWAVDEIVELLKRADMKLIMTDFGGESGKDDPVVHFYETFLKAYNPELRETRGVYYTPSPVVEFIVRSVDQVLSRDFGKKKGLADDTTLILDPAVGTGSFLHSVSEKIYSYFNKNKGAWNSYVADNLLDRIFGFEILMAPYSVAHLKLGLQLRETGYTFEKDQRLGVYLTNTLEEAARKSQELLFDWISDEANAASAIKKDKPIMVVLGNPPYAGNSANKGKWIVDLLNGYDGITQKKTDNYFLCDGKPLGEKNPKWLNDDYVKFIRFAQWRIKQTGHGVLAFITNHGYLDNPTFRGMRQSLMNSFDELYVLDLHGNSKKKEKCPDGSKDENVFDIQQGVSICFFIRKLGDHERKAKVFRFDQFGLRDKKYAWLLKNDIETIPWKTVTPSTPFYLFTSGQDSELQKEFYQYPKLTDIFPVNVLGFQTHRDQFAIAYTENEMQKRVTDLRSGNVPDDDIVKTFEIKENESWNLKSAKKALKTDSDYKSHIVECAYRPFDIRWCYLDNAIMDRPRPELVNYVANKKNLCLLSSRQQAVPGYFHSWITNLPANDCFISTKSREANQVFPLYIFQTSPLEQAAGRKPTKQPNISRKLVDQLSAAWNIEFKGSRNKNESFTPEDIAHYIYAILNSPYYRERHIDLLKTDFPRIPFPKNSKDFFELAEQGEKLASLHLFDTKDVQPEVAVDFPIKGTNEIERLSFDPKTTRLYINKEQYFSGVSPRAWEFKIGGYDVLVKWLKDRPNSVLSYADIKMFRKIIGVFDKTIEIGSAIDKTIKKHGAWPFSSINLTEISSKDIRVVQEKVDATLSRIEKKKKRAA